MDITTLAEMQQPDTRSLMWHVWTADPAKTAQLAQHGLSQIELAPAVPDTTRQAFERLCTLFAYGILCYDLYTVAGDLARMVTEQALRERFLPFYAGQLTFIRADGQREEQVTADRWDAIPRRLLQDSRWLLKPRSGHAPIEFNGMLASLLRWARAERLLRGQGDRLRDPVRAWFRNYAAHPSWHLQGPDHAERAIADLASIINRIWGAPSGTVVHREPIFITWTDTAVSWGGQGASWANSDDGDSAVAVIVLGVLHDPDLDEYDALYENTNRPCDYLWGPGTPTEAVEWLHQHPQTGDQAETIDRLFLLRYHGDRLYLPQEPSIASAQFSDGDDATWYLLRADTPIPAFNHQRCVLSGYTIPESATSHNPVGECSACPAETIASGSLSDMLACAAHLGSDISPHPVPDVRVAMSHTPRCNRIHDGYWDLPPDEPSTAWLITSARDARRENGERLGHLLL